MRDRATVLEAGPGLLAHCARQRDVFKATMASTMLFTDGTHARAGEAESGGSHSHQCEEASTYVLEGK